METIDKNPVVTVAPPLAVSDEQGEVPLVIPARPKVSQVRHRDPAHMLHPRGPRTQPMQGFDDEFTDIVDYIYRITYRIWVNRAVGLIYRYYDHACTVYTPYATTRTVEDVVASTGTMLHAFPDRESHFLNVAWSGDEVSGFYTSHLGFSRMTNKGPTLYGPATGKRVLIRTAADCISLNNKIHTEWLIRDNGALVRQMGLDRHHVARKLAEQEPQEVPSLSATSRMRGQNGPIELEMPRETPAQLIAHALHDFWNRRRFDVLDDLYRPDVIVHSAGGRIAIGVRNLAALMLSLLASVPDATLRLEHACWSEERDGVIVAARWTLEGTTRTGGLLGDVPANRQIAMMGISHFRLAGRRIAEEWTLFDEVAVLVQAYRGINGHGN